MHVMWKMKHELSHNLFLSIKGGLIMLFCVMLWLRVNDERRVSYNASVCGAIVKSHRSEEDVLQWFCVWCYDLVVLTAGG